jgi:hypothetical protein
MLVEANEELPKISWRESENRHFILKPKSRKFARLYAKKILLSIFYIGETLIL